MRADCDGCGCADDGEEQKLRGAVFLAVGGGLTAVGVPLIVVGGRSVERNESRRAPEVMVGSRGASLRWHF